MFVNWFAGVVKFEFVLATTHPEDLKSVYFGYEFGCCRRLLLCVHLKPASSHIHRLDTTMTYLEEHVRETGSEVGPVDIQLLLARYVDILTAGAVHFHSTRREFFAHANRQHILPFTQNSRARAEIAQHIFLLHHGETPRRQNESSVD